MQPKVLHNLRVTVFVLIAKKSEQNWLAFRIFSTATAGLLLHDFRSRSMSSSLRIAGEAVVYEVKVTSTQKKRDWKNIVLSEESRQ